MEVAIDGPSRPPYSIVLPTLWFCTCVTTFLYTIPGGTIDIKLYVIRVALRRFSFLEKAHIQKIVCCVSKKLRHSLYSRAVNASGRAIAAPWKGNSLLNRGHFTLLGAIVVVMKSLLLFCTFVVIIADTAIVNAAVLPFEVPFVPSGNRTTG